jgi:hypothetical protein
VVRRVALTAALLTLAMPAQAHAVLTLAEDIGTSDTGRQFRALEMEDPSESRNVVSLRSDGPWVEVADRTAGIANLPEGCVAGEEGAVRCPRADYDIFYVATGKGPDLVRTRGLSYPSLSPRQVIGPAVFTPMNVRLGAGRDKYFPGQGTDSVFGGPARDRIQTGTASDFLVGGKGRDRLVGQRGADFLLGGPGGDRLVAGTGVSDLMLGGSGRDFCFAREPRDRVSKCELVYLGSRRVRFP